MPHPTDPKSTAVPLPPNDHWNGSFSLLEPALRSLKRNQEFLLIYAGASTVLSALAYLASSRTSISPNMFQAGIHTTGVYNVVLLLQFIFEIVIIGPLLVYVLATAKQKDLAVGQITQQGLAKLLPLIGLFILLSVMITIGLVLLIVPGIYLLYRLVFSAFLVIEKNLDPISAIKESWRITAGHGKQIFSFFGVSILITIMGAIISTVIPIFGQLANLVGSLVVSIIAVWLYSFIMSNSPSPESHSAA